MSCVVAPQHAAALLIYTSCFRSFAMGWRAYEDYHLSRTEDAAQIILIFDECQPLREVCHFLLPLSYRVGIE